MNTTLQLLENPIILVAIIAGTAAILAPTITGIWGIILAMRAKQDALAAAETLAGHTRQVADTLAKHTEEDKQVAEATTEKLQCIHGLVNGRLTALTQENADLRHANAALTLEIEKLRWVPRESAPKKSDRKK